MYTIRVLLMSLGIYLSACYRQIYALRSERFEDDELGSVDEISMQNASHPFVTLPDSVGTGLTLYNTFNAFMGIGRKVADLRAVQKYHLSEDLIKNLDSLRAVHDLLVAKVGLEPAAWDATCFTEGSNELLCSDEELDDKYQFTQHVSIGGAVDYATEWVMSRTGSDGQDTCPHRLKKAVAMMRKVLVHLNEQSDDLIAQLSSTDVNEIVDEPYRALDDRGCDGDCEGCDEVDDDSELADSMIDSLASFGEETDDSSRRGLMCRELSTSLTRTQVLEQCQTQCNKMDGCKGFTMYNGTLTHNGRRWQLDSLLPMPASIRYGWNVMKPGDVVEIVKNGNTKDLKQCRHYPLLLAEQTDECATLGRQALECNGVHAGCWETKSLQLIDTPFEEEELHNRCCFRTSVENEYFQEATECYQKPPVNPLFKLDTEGVAKWVEALPADDGAFAEALTKAAAHIRAQALDGIPLNGIALLTMGYVKLAQLLAMKIDHAFRMLCMIDATKYGSTPGECLIARTYQLYKKSHGLVDPFIFFAVKTSTSTGWSLGAVSKLVKLSASYLGQYAWVGQASVGLIGMTLDVMYTKGNVKTLVGMPDWLGVAAAAASLIDRGLTIAWQQCSVVETWLRRTDLSDVENLERLLADHIK